MVDVILTRAAIETRTRRALVDVGETAGAEEALQTQALEAVRAVHTRAAIGAGIGRALVDVMLADGAREAYGREWSV
jgi:hypothetical protein